MLAHHAISEGEKEWWVLGPDNKTVPGGIVPTREEAFAIALEHSKAYGANAVYVHGIAGKNGKWEEPSQQPLVTEEMRMLGTE
jgi:hypothetical protein